MNLRLPFVVAFVFGGLLFGTGSMGASPTGVSYFPTGFDQTGFSFSDLDVRDADNRPVTTVTAQDELQEIFRSGLYDLLVCAELYTVAEALSVIEKALNLGTQSLVRNIPATVGRVLSALLSPIKKFRHDALGAFSGIPAFTLPLLMTLLSSLCFLSAPERAPLCIIRC